MSTTTESRVLEMRFDNKEFEANAQQTLKTLQELKKALDENISGEAFNNIDQAAKNVDLSGISSGIEQLTDRFSTMGIVGMRVIENITDALMNKLSSAVSSVFSKITEGGLRRAQNIENARFQLQGLIDDEEEVAAIMKEALDSVDGTAYAYDSAAKAASMFAATGIRAGDEMKRSLKAIAGVAATTNSDYDEMAHIFTTVSGQGKIMTEQLNQLANRGLNAAASLATYFNKVADGSVDASDHVKQLLANIGATGPGIDLAASESAMSVEDAYEEATKAYKRALKERQKAYNAEYKDLQKTLNAEYTIKKKSYDAEYKALSKSLDEEIKAVQEANQETLKSVQERYSTEINAAREATTEKIKLINQEYMENLKLIDEERYNKLKAIDDEIDAIHKQAEEEEKARRAKERKDTLAAYDEAIAAAQTISYREQLQDQLAKYKEQLAEEDRELERQEHIKDLNEQKKLINEEYDEKRKKASEGVSEKIAQIQKEGQETVEALQKQYDAEMKALRESQANQLEQLREAKTQKLEALRESQSNELNVIKEGHNAQLEQLKESQSDELEAWKEAEAERLEILKQDIKSGLKAIKTFEDGMDFDEAIIREMVTNGLIDFDTFAEAMGTTFGDHAKDANKTFSGSMANIGAALAKVGALFYSPFLKQNGEMVNLFNAIRIKINEFKEALKPFASAITKNVLDVIKEIAEVVSNLDMSFRGVRESAEGDLIPINKLTYLGLTLSNIFIGLVNVFKAVISYIKPVISAFRDMFSIDHKGLKDASNTFRKFTEKLEASEEVVEGIYTVFVLLFGTIRSVVEVGFGAIKAILPSISSGFLWLAEKISGVLIYFAGLISYAIDWVQHSEKVQNAIIFIKEAIDSLIDSITNLYRRIKNNVKLGIAGKNIGIDFSNGFLSGMMSVVRTIVNYVWNFCQTVMDTVCKAFRIESPSKFMKWVAEMFVQGFTETVKFLTEKAIPFISDCFLGILDAIKTIFTGIDWDGMIGSVSTFVVNFITTISNGLSKGISWLFNHIDEFFRNVKAYINGEEFDDSPGWKIIFAIIDGMRGAINALWDGIKDVSLTLWNAIFGFLKEFSLKDMAILAWDVISTFFSTAIDKIKEWTGPFAEALKDFFGSLDSGEIIAIASGVGIIFMIIKAVQTLTRWITPLEGFTGALIGLKSALIGWGLNLKAGAVLKIAAAVGIIGLTMVLLFETFKNLTNDDKLTFLAIAGIVEVILMTLGFIAVAISKMLTHVYTIHSATTELAKSLKAIAIGFEIKLIVASIVGSLGSIIISLATLFALYKTDKEALKESTNIMLAIAAIIGVLVIVAAGMAAALKKENAMAFAAVTIAFLAFAAGIILIMKAIKDITEMKLTKADSSSLLILAGIFLLVGLVISRISESIAYIRHEGGGSGGMGIATAISFCILTILAIHEIKKLIKEGMTLQNSWKQLLLIGGVFLIIGVTIGIINRLAMQGKASMAGLGTMLGVAATLMASIWAIKELAEVPVRKYISGLLKLMGLFVIVGAVVLVATNATTDRGTVNAAYKSILGIAVVIGVLTIAVAALTMIEPGPALKAAGILALMLVTLGAALAGAGTLADASIYTFTSILIMLGGIIFITYLLEELTKYSWQSLLGAAGSIALVLVAMGVAMKLISDTKINLHNVGMCIAGLFSVFMVGVILALICQINSNWTDVLSIAGSISLCIVAIGICLSLMDGIKVNGKAIAAFAVGIAGVILIGIMLAGLSSNLDVSMQEVLSLAAGMSLVIIAIGVCIALMNDAKLNWQGVVAIIAGAVAAGIIAFALQQFYVECDILSLLAFATGISEVLIALGVALAIMGDTKFDISMVGGIFMGLFSVIVIAGVLSLFVNQVEADIPTLLGFATAISEVLLAIGVAVTIVSALGGSVNMSAMILFAEATVAACAVAWSLEEFSSGADPKELLALATSVAIVLIALSVVVGIVSVVGLIAAAGATAGCLALIEVVGTVGLLLAALGGLAQIEGFDKIMSDGGKVLSDIGTAIRDFVGCIIEGVGGHIADLLPVIGEKLADFADKAKPFFKVMKDLANSGNVLDGAKALALLIATLGAAEVIQCLGALASKVAEKILGKSSMEAVGEELAKFGTNLTNFYNNTSGIENAERFKMIAEAAGYMLSIAKDIPNSGGKLAELLGDNTLDMFGEQLEKFSSHLITIAANFAVVEIDSKKFQDIADAITVMIRVAASIPNSGGYLADWIGDNTFDTFGDQLEKFSEHLKPIVTNFNGVKIDIEHVQEIADATSIMINISKKIPNSGGLLAKLIGDNTMSQFGYQLKLFSDHMVNIIKNFDGIEISKLTDFSEATELLVTAATNIKNKKLEKDDSIIDFGDKLVTFSEKIRIICDEKLTNIDNFNKLMDVLDRFILLKDGLTMFNPSGFVAFMTALQTIGVESIKKFLDAFSGDQTLQIVDAITNLFNTIQKEFLNPMRLEMMKNLGRTFGTTIISGMTDKTIMNVIATVSKSLIDLVVMTMQSETLRSRSYLMTAGRAITSEFLVGMVDPTTRALYAKSSTEIIMNLANNLSNKINTTMIEAAGKLDSISFVSGFIDKTSLDVVKKGGTAYVKYLADWLKIDSNTLYLTGAGMLDSIAFIKGFAEETTLNKIKDFLTKFIEFVSKILIPSNGLVGGASNPFIKAGEADSESFVSGFHVDDRVESVLRNFIISISNYLKGWEFRDQFRDAGKNAGYGFAEGLRDGDVSRVVRDYARDMAIEAYNESRRALDEHSPSRKMMEVGSFAGEGFVIGFSNWISSAAQAGNDMGETAKEGLSEAISKIASEIQNEEQFNPTITPVLDLTNIQDGMNQMGGMLNLDEPLRLAANAGMSFSGGVNDILGNIQASMPDGSNADVVDAINQMRYDMSQMSAAIRQMQIVLDTGELVGAMTDPLDNSMGFNQILSERGVR